MTSTHPQAIPGNPAILASPHLRTPPSTLSQFPTHTHTTHSSASNMTRHLQLPRFLLPRGSRSYTTPKLAKPTKYTPPSHSTRVKDPVNYPGFAVKSDPTKRYPNTMPPPETWSHYILTSRKLHFYLSLGILGALAGTVSISNFLNTSPYAEEIEWSWSHPIMSLERFKDAWKKTVEERSKAVAEMRKKKLEDIEKRGEYRKRFGLEETGNEGGFGGFGIKTKEEDRRVQAAVEVQRRLLEQEEKKVNGQGDWVEEELRKLEKVAEDTAGELVEEKRKLVDGILKQEGLSEEEKVKRMLAVVDEQAVSNDGKSSAENVEVKLGEETPVLEEKKKKSSWW
ncbi:hypothetical protein BZA77DRAFT_322219 [Pyronema omphalodes]|nr:hypothetical protein BZA77DRAFT_322219 [Pyronema omphalodes]